MFATESIHLGSFDWSSKHIGDIFVILSTPSHDSIRSVVDVSEREGGTQQPASVCDVEYYGLTSPVKGTVVHPEPHRLFAMEGPIKCRQHFIPAANQSVIIRVSSTNRVYSLATRHFSQNNQISMLVTLHQILSAKS